LLLSLILLMFLIAKRRNRAIMCARRMKLGYEDRRHDHEG
jgi:hypothetical protein